jgi:hypothetical protein
MGARGNAAADLLLARRAQPPAPPVLTLVATADPACTRCGTTSRRLIPAYWAPDRVRLCPPCCAEVVGDYDRDERLWPAGPIDAAAAVPAIDCGEPARCPAEPPATPVARAGYPADRLAATQPGYPTKPVGEGR